MTRRESKAPSSRRTCQGRTPFRYNPTRDQSPTPGSPWESDSAPTPTSIRNNKNNNRSTEDDPRPNRRNTPETPPAATQNNRCKQNPTILRRRGRPISRIRNLFMLDHRDHTIPAANTYLPSRFNTVPARQKEPAIKASVARPTPRFRILFSPTSDDL